MERLLCGTISNVRTRAFDSKFMDRNVFLELAFRKMNRLLSLIQFLPLSIFLGVARAHGFTGESWALAFQWGALTALVETIILLPLLGNGLSRLIAGANFFLILGGIAFFFNFQILLSLIDSSRESGIFFSLLLVCMLGILTTPTGVFEKGLSKSKAEIKYSRYFVIGIVAAIFWSIYFRGNPMLAGTLPFVSLALLKQLLQRKLSTI